MRVESKVIGILAKPHQLTPNEYLGFIAKMLAHIPRSMAGRMADKSTVLLCYKIDAKHAAILARQAKRKHLEVTTLSSLYLHEKIVEKEYIGIRFRDAFGVREAYVAGHRMAVWEIVDLFNQAKTVSKTAEKLGWPSALVRCALKYAKKHATEVARQRKAAKPNRNFYLTEFRLKQAHERGDSVRRKVVNAEGGSLSATEAARKLGISKATVLRRCKKRMLIAWRTTSKSPVRVPVWQFHRRKVMGGIEETLRVLNRDKLINDFGRILFFLSKFSLLGGRRPLDCLRKGEVTKVLRTAHYYIE